MNITKSKKWYDCGSSADRKCASESLHSRVVAKQGEINQPTPDAVALQNTEIPATEFFRRNKIIRQKHLNSCELLLFQQPERDWKAQIRQPSTWLLEKSN